MYFLLFHMDFRACLNVFFSTPLVLFRIASVLVSGAISTVNG
jgi:hypothetical protein